MRWLVIIGAVLLGVIGVVIAVGYSLPVKHVASRSADIAAPPGRVWTAITDVATMPQWRPGMKSAEVVGRTDAGPRWREVTSDGTITLETLESVPERRLVVRIADKSLPFGGSWTYELTPVPTGTRLTIREDGEVYNPVFRFVSRFIMGHHATIDKDLAALQEHLGGSAKR